jgi:hypothetical protein
MNLEHADEVYGPGMLAASVGRTYLQLAVYCFPFNLFRNTLNAVIMSRQVASRRRIGASGRHEFGAASN